MPTVYFVTNRNPLPNEGNPKDFGPHFSPKGIDDLRFGRANVEWKAGAWRVVVDPAKERITTRRSELKLGSREIFQELQQAMQTGTDTLVFVHGYNVSFQDALIAGAQLLERHGANHPLNVVVFTWPSDGMLLIPAKLQRLYAYKSDRSDARASGPAFARGFLKAADFLRMVTRSAACPARIHLMAHSMGNYVLRNAVQEMCKHLTGPMPRLFDQLLMMAADEDFDAFELEHKLLSLPELAGAIHVYFNRNDVALTVSDQIKFNPARLGLQGPRLPLNIPGNVTLVNVTEAVTQEQPRERTGHGYYVSSARVEQDVGGVLTGAAPDRVLGRRYVPSLNQYVLE